MGEASNVCHNADFVGSGSNLLVAWIISFHVHWDRCVSQPTRAVHVFLTQLFGHRRRTPLYIMHNDATALVLALRSHSFSIYQANVESIRSTLRKDSEMPRGGGGGCRGGGGGYRSGGSYRGGSSASTSSTKSSSGKEGSSSKKTGADEKSTAGASRNTPGGGTSYSSATTRSSEVIHTLGPSSKACENAHRELRTCLEANDDRMSSCHWYLTQWKTCQQQSLRKNT